MSKITVEVDIEPITCVNCGTHFGMDAALTATRRKNGQVFWCPNGHEMFYNPEPDKLKTELIRVSQELERSERREQQARQDAIYADQRRAAMKGQVTKLKNRAANGVCPCCNRSFVALHRHMLSKHPGFEIEQE